MIFFAKEKKVLDLIEKHAQKVEECLSTSLEALEAYLAGNIFEAKKMARQTDNLESQADLIRHEVRDTLYLGAYLPNLREDVYKLVESIDSVANVTEKCCDIFLNQRPEVPAFLKDDFLKLIQVSIGIIKPLKSALLCYLKGVCPIEESRHHARDVGLIESEADKLDWDLTKKIFSSDLEHSKKLHLKICVRRIVEITDKAEYAADLLDMVILKSMV